MCYKELYLEHIIEQVVNFVLFFCWSLSCTLWTGLAAGFLASPCIWPSVAWVLFFSPFSSFSPKVVAHPQHKFPLHSTRNASTKKHSNKAALFFSYQACSRSNSKPFGWLVSARTCTESIRVLPVKPPVPAHFPNMVTASYCRNSAVSLWGSRPRQWVSHWVKLGNSARRRKRAMGHSHAQMACPLHRLCDDVAASETAADPVVVCSICKATGKHFGSSQKPPHSEHRMFIYFPAWETGSFSSPRPSTLGPRGEKCSVWTADEPGESAKGLSFVISLEVHVLFPLIEPPPCRPSPHIRSPRNANLLHRGMSRFSGPCASVSGAPPKDSRTFTSVQICGSLTHFSIELYSNQFYEITTCYAPPSVWAHLNHSRCA